MCKTYGRTPALRDVTVAVARGECLALVGESGSGKSVTMMSLLRLIPMPPGEIVSGEAKFEGVDLLTLPKDELRQVRGGQIGFIFQDPMTSLNPVLTVGYQIMESLKIHQKMKEKDAEHRAEELLATVGIPDPRRRLESYPFELSGGMRQRVMIAIALSCNPRLLLADEPTTALDVTIQAQILELLRSLQERFGMAVILITHDLGVVAEFVDRVLVMYAGRVVEQAAVHPTFEEPLHPYTEGLLGSIPSLDDERERLQVIPGVVPSPFALPPGCRYAPRCPYARPACDAADPPLLALQPHHQAACIRHTDYQIPSRAMASAS